MTFFLSGISIGIINTESPKAKAILLEGWKWFAAVGKLQLMISKKNVQHIISN